jgi:putative metallohydrolase (TIGR04338 family)
VNNDFQRQKVYTAESRWRWHTVETVFPRFKSCDEVAAWLRKLMRQAWFQDRWPTVRLSRVYEARKGAYTSTAARHTGAIKLATYDAYTALHELGHLTVPITMPGHGILFAKNMLILVKHVFGAEAAEGLRENFDRYKVTYEFGPKRVAQLRAKVQHLVKHFDTSAVRPGTTLPIITVIMQSGDSFGGRFQLDGNVLVRSGIHQTDALPLAIPLSEAAYIRGTHRFCDMNTCKTARDQYYG